MRYGVKTLVAALAACLVVGLLPAGPAVAQQTTTTTETKTFQVISVEGNTIVVRGEDGATKEITVPEDFRFDVSGQQMSVHELKPGMKGTATISTTTTVKPVTVTEVRNATVVQATGSSVLVRGANGYRNFSEADLAKRHVKIVRDGQPVELSELRAGDKLTATIITEKPPEVMTQRQVQARMAPGEPAAPAPLAGSTAGTSQPPAAPGAAAGTSGSGGAAAEKTLPKTASTRPLVGLIGVVSLAIAVFLTSWARRRWPSRRV
jgi:hypothetical protein